jgi:hypothetical protein
MQKVGRPAAGEVDAYYFNYIDRVPDDDVIAVLAERLEEATRFWSAISEEKSRHRYQPDKWSLREVLGHVNDTERVFQFRTFWFARGFAEEPLPSFDEDVSAAGAPADERPLASLLEEFRAVRQSGLALVRSIPHEAWTRRGTASGKPCSARAAAFAMAGHEIHHVGIARERYL